MRRLQASTAEAVRLRARARRYRAAGLSFAAIGRAMNVSKVMAWKYVRLEPKRAGTGSRQGSGGGPPGCQSHQERQEQGRGEDRSTADDNLNVGGPCSPGTGQRGQSDVEAVIAGERFFAARQWRGGTCAYYGHITGDRVQGVEFCPGAEGLTFALRFPPGADREARERYRGRDQDDFLDDPRTYTHRR